MLKSRFGGIHWTDPVSVSDPHALVMSYAQRFFEAGGRFATGDATSLAAIGQRLARADQRWPGRGRPGRRGARRAANKVTKPFGYDPPTFGKRGYHRHYKLQGNAVLNRPVLDTESAFLLAPMRAGVRLTTGAEFAGIDEPPTPVQLARAEPVARTLLPLGDAVEPEPWMGVRPCTPDMLPIIGKLPGQQGTWCAFGHAHQGFTLGPTTGRMMAEMMTGETPFIDPEPYRADRF